jgi:hypothetical protein
VEVCDSWQPFGPGGARLQHLQKKMTRPWVWLHDPVDVHLLESKLCSFFLLNWKILAKIYFLRYAVTQYGIKKLFDLWCHGGGFNVDAEWHNITWQKVYVMGLGSTTLTWKAVLQTPSVEELLDNMTIVQAGLCKDFHSHLQVLYCWRRLQINFDGLD